MSQLGELIFLEDFRPQPVESELELTEEQFISLLKQEVRDIVVDLPDDILFDQMIRDVVCPCCYQQLDPELMPSG